LVLYLAQNDITKENINQVFDKWQVFVYNDCIIDLRLGTVNRAP